MLVENDTLIGVLRGIPGTRHLCLEEGTHASRLCELLSPHVEEIVVVGVSESRGLSRNANPTLKGMFRGAPTTVIGQAV